MRYAPSYVTVCFPCRVAFTFIAPAVTKCWASERVRGRVVAQAVKSLPHRGGPDSITGTISVCFVANEVALQLRWLRRVF